MTGWIRATPALNVHAVLIERDGHLVYEEYFSGQDERRGRPLGMVTFTREMTHDIRSVTKSVVSALVGIAAGSGAIRSLDTPLLDYFPTRRSAGTREAAAHHPARADDERRARLERERVVHRSKERRDRHGS
jgi:CubicO group peptidase (beta-lactamase class C family)